MRVLVFAVLLITGFGINAQKMTTMKLTEREQVVELVNKLYYYTDEQNWEGLRNEVFTTNVHLNMTSLGGPDEETTAQAITDMWSEGFKDIDAVNHLGGNYIVDFDEGKVLAYATAHHYKKEATQGNTREFVGTYDLGIVKVDGQWRINAFKYNLKYMTGNIELK